MEELVEKWENEEEAEHQTRPVSTVRVQGARDVVWKLGSRVSMTNVQGKKRRENHTYNF